MPYFQGYVSFREGKGVMDVFFFVEGFPTKMMIFGDFVVGLDGNSTKKSREK